MRDVEHFAPDKAKWKEMVARHAPKILVRQLDEQALGEWDPGFDRGVILAGEKLLEGTHFAEMREQYHDKVRAGEMEGSGFARACWEYKIDWLVFRGISDYGDDDGGVTRDKWKRLAALSVSAFTRMFLESDYRKAEDRVF